MGIEKEKKPEKMPFASGLPLKDSERTPMRSLDDIERDFKEAEDTRSKEELEKRYTRTPEQIEEANKLRDRIMGESKEEE